ncbi:MAG: hypothetical protein FJ298_10555 [Planctomycetes bacterium]|nr:hypothetical protein [Planctomycetota bacterium]
MASDPLVPTTGKLHAQLATGTPPPETDDDLFNFVEIRQTTAPKPALPKSDPAAVAPSTLAHVDAPAAVAPSAAPLAPQAAPTARAERERFSMSPLATALFAAVLVANVALMAFAWNSVNATRDLVLDVAHDVREASADLRNESNQRSAAAARASEPAFGALPEGYRTLELARERVAQGEHVRARRMLHGLLAVIDRVELPAREEIEARAGFLIADSYRLEADALARNTERSR